MTQRKPASAVTRLPANVKFFVLDTNVLMHDPTSLFRFEEHDIYIPMATLEELDKRVIGLPGETIDIQGDTVKLIASDGTETILTEPYIKSMAENTSLTETLGEREKGEEGIGSTGK